MKKMSIRRMIRKRGQEEREKSDCRRSSCYVILLKNKYIKSAVRVRYLSEDNARIRRERHTDDYNQGNC